MSFNVASIEFDFHHIFIRRPTVTVWLGIGNKKTSSSAWLGLKWVMSHTSHNGYNVSRADAQCVSTAHHCGCMCVLVTTPTMSFSFKTAWCQNSSWANRNKIICQFWKCWRQTKWSEVTSELDQCLFWHFPQWCDVDFYNRNKYTSRPRDS